MSFIFPQCKWKVEAYITLPRVWMMGRAVELYIFYISSRMNNVYDAPSNVSVKRKDKYLGGGWQDGSSGQCTFQQV